MVRKTIWLLLAILPGIASAAVIGHMAPAEPVTDARIAMLPAAQQAAWHAYLARSQALEAADASALAAERAGGPAPADPAEGRNGGAGMPLDRPTAWYGTPDARHVADVIVSFQTPAGGWGKNVDRSGALRQRGQSWVPGGHGYVGTIDNNATTTELRFLARVQAQLPGAPGEAYRAAFLKGLRYLLDAQYPNGGFPQVYPLEGGYHDAITFNDDAMVDVTQLLDSAARRQGDYGFVPAASAGQARVAADKALHVILATQVAAAGGRTAWGQQYDALTLMPAGARNFEPIALSSSESASLLIYLMALPDPAPGVVSAVHAGAGWLEQTALRDIDWTARSRDTGRQRLAHPGAGPIWARYYDIATMTPIFGDRDRSIHDDVNEISLERRNGYAWYGTRPAEALARFSAWAPRHPLQAPSSAMH